MTQTSSVVAGWLAAVTRTLEALGHDADQLLLEAGADLADKYVQEARFSSALTRRFWPLAVARTGHADIGLHAARFVCPTTFHALGFSLWASASLYEALERMVRFAALLNDGADLALEAEGDNYRFCMRVQVLDQQAQIAPEGVDYFLGAVSKLLRDMRGPAFAPLEVNLRRAAPVDPTPWREHFGAPVHFAAHDDSLLLNAAELRRPLPTGNPELARQNDRLVAEYLARHQLLNPALQVRARLLELLPGGTPSLEAVAAALGSNPRTLQYRLTRQGTSFSEILDEVRASLARQYVQQSQQSFSALAYALGFSEPSHFNRAFKRWTGETPSRFRARLCPAAGKGAGSPL
ncbi:MAG: AraC family transcriptional regulator [Pseudomonas sp.]|nr:AraC family transcriptional regulator [Pseudomonas sp.]